MMKRKICILLAVMMLFATVAPSAFAAELAVRCPKCNRVITDIDEEEVVVEEPCQITGDPDMPDEVHYYTYTYNCNSCGHSDRECYTVVDCPH